MKTEGEINDLLKALIDESFDTGYYQATIEKCAARLDDNQLKAYAKLNQEAISKRNNLREEIMNRLYHSEKIDVCL
jgi:hypothetical protein